jgi:DNA sulfur modification protein DndC
MSLITKDEINNLKSIIKELYLMDKIPWVIGYSGGKDSTATLQLVWFALSELSSKQKKWKDVHIISTDTLVESPVVAKWVDDSLEKMKVNALAQGLPFLPHRLKPDVNDSFWTNLLGRGYPYPRQNFRWCTDRLKIKPANTFVQNMVSSYGEVILLLGTRKAESKSRAKTMEHYEAKRSRKYLSPNGAMQNELIFSPLENWLDDDVWAFLMQYENPWNNSNKDLLTMYKGATADGECPLVMSTDTPSCGKSRFGCWVCTMVEQDKSMAAMIMNDSEKEWMLPLLEFRNEIGTIELDRDRRDFRRMSGNVKAFHGRLIHGPYKKDIREKWLKKLLEIQMFIRNNGPQEVRDITLITNEELNAIRNIWLFEKHEFDDALPRIYAEVMHQNLPKDQGIITEASFGRDEWNLLSNVSHKMFPDEELLFETAARIIDIEQNSFETKKRYGILKDVEAQITRGFYKNEDDALAYTLGKLQRKRDLGASYDSKAEGEGINLFNEEDKIDET